MHVPMIAIVPRRLVATDARRLFVIVSGESTKACARLTLADFREAVHFDKVVRRLARTAASLPLGLIRLIRDQHAFPGGLAIVVSAFLLLCGMPAARIFFSLFFLRARAAARCGLLVDVRPGRRIAGH